MKIALYYRYVKICADMWRTPVARWGVRAPSLLSLLGVTPPSSQWTAVAAPLPEWRLQSLSQLATSRQWTTGKIFDNSAKNIWQNYLQQILKWLEWCQEGQDEGLATLWRPDLTILTPSPLLCRHGLWYREDHPQMASLNIQLHHFGRTKYSSDSCCELETRKQKLIAHCYLQVQFEVANNL